MSKRSTVPYDQYFYETVEPMSRRSAKEVAPIIFDLLGPASVIDVGCGTGTWLRELMEIGVTSVQGIDGEYVDPKSLLIPQECYGSHDLKSVPFQCATFDLAMCLEVGEHLPKGCAEALVQSLVNASQVVLFSAALPGQGGKCHINEQWPSYWQALFANHGYAAVDAIRPKIRDNQNVIWWYRQNLILFASGQAIKQHPALAPFTLRDGQLPTEWIHYHLVTKPDTIRVALGKLLRSIAHCGRSHGQGSGWPRMSHGSPVRADLNGLRPGGQVMKRSAVIPPLAWTGC